MPGWLLNVEMGGSRDPPDPSTIPGGEGPVGPVSSYTKTMAAPEDYNSAIGFTATIEQAVNFDANITNP